MLTIAVLIPITSNILHVLKIVKIGFDITPVSFAFTLLFMGVAVLKYKFLSIIPIALHRIVNNVEEAIIVIDYSDSVIFYNDLFFEYFKASSVSKNSDINIFVEYIKSISAADKSIKSFCEALQTNKLVVYDGEICIDNTQIKHFNVKIRPIKGNKDEVLGRIITFHDICEYVNLLDNLNVKNKKLIRSK